MGREIHHDSILALEKQIEEHERAIIRLKRARNSLLNVSTLLPPEIIDSIFHWNVIPDGDFGGLSKGSYNFLLVCHHWFEVASHTPELWYFWGNSIRDWTRRHTRSCGTAPLDLVLDECGNDELDDELRDVLRDRAARDTIRRVHLKGFDTAESFSSIISAIATQGEEPRSSSVESFMVKNSSDYVDVSAFFSRYQLPKLHRLCLYGCRISSWGLLKSHTMALTTLRLTSTGVRRLSPDPTPSQLISILSSNPLIQDLTLSCDSAPDIIDSDRPSPRIPLRHLKTLYLSSSLHYAFLLLNQLELPNKMEILSLSLDNFSPSEISRTLGPYLGDRIRRRGRFPGGGLGLRTNRIIRGFSLEVGSTRTGEDPAEVVWFVQVSMLMGMQLEDEEADRLGFDLIVHIPQERVIYLQTALPVLHFQELCAKMRNLACLHLLNMDLSGWLLEPDIHGSHKFEELLCGLDNIIITRPTLDDSDWNPLINFLSRRAAIGNRVHSLRISDHPHMDENVAESIKRMVGVFEDEVFGDEVFEDDDGVMLSC